LPFSAIYILGAVVALGGLGVVTKLTLNLLLSFNMKQIVYMDLPMGILKDHFLEIMSSGYSVSCFTSWQNRNIDQVWIKSVVDSENPDAQDFDLEKFGAKKLVDVDVHPIIELPAEHATEQKGVPGPWFDRLTHFRIGFMPSTAVELQVFEHNG
jgi:alditol oxidase